MKVIETRKQDNTLLELTFMAETDEDFKAQVKSYLQQHYPTITWEQFFNRVTFIQGNRIILSME